MHKSSLLSHNNLSLNSMSVASWQFGSMIVLVNLFTLDVVRFEYNVNFWMMVLMLQAEMGQQASINDDDHALVVMLIS